MSQSFNILFIQDEFLPQLGGVELATFYMANSLIKRGHRCIVMTPTRQGREGVWWIGEGIKVYYVPKRPVIFGKQALPSFCDFLLFRSIVLRENIDIVHA